MIPNGSVTPACSLAQRAGDNPPWHGAKILVAEDNHLQAEVVGDFLRDCGLEPVGPADRLEEACELAQGRPLDGALLDVKLGENLCFPVCSILAARKIPFILLTGYRQSSLIPPALCAAPLVCKPFREDELGAALALILNCRVGNRASANVAASGLLFQSQCSTTHTDILSHERRTRLSAEQTSSELRRIIKVR
jgi:DNA-binding response OmpR family regulator